MPEHPHGGGPARALFVFVDGVGIGEPDPELNPIVRAADRLPALREISGGTVPTLADPRVDGPGGRAFPLDATLDVVGVPQSGTGQAALLTGASAAEIFGRHFGPWTPVSLRGLVEHESVLRSAVAAGRTVAFANAYPRGWPGPRGGKRIAGPPLAARGAGVLTRHEEQLANGSAVASEILNDGWQTRVGEDSIPRVTAEQAGRNLERISRSVELTLYAHYATDTAGHRRNMEDAVQALELLDRFLGGLLEELADDTLLLLASDHGNLEDVRTGHTRNPAMGMARGPGADLASRASDIRDVAPFLRDLLGLGS